MWNTSPCTFIPIFAGRTPFATAVSTSALLPAHAFDTRLPAELSFGADFSRDTRDLAGEPVELIDHAIDGRANAEEFALHLLAVDLELDLLRQISLGHGFDYARHFGRRLYEIRDEAVDRVDRRDPLAANTGHGHAIAHLPLATHRAAHPRDFVDQSRLL